MRRYKNAKIYKITNDIDDYIYVGSTTKRLLNDRMRTHSSSCIDPKVSNHNCKLYQHMRKLDMYYFNIELLEEYPCKTNLELRMKEQEWMDKYDWNLLLNQRRAIKKIGKATSRPAVLRPVAGKIK